jgi:hypothetical protein
MVVNITLIASATIFAARPPARNVPPHEISPAASSAR